MADHGRPYPAECRHCGLVGEDHWKWNPNKNAHFGGTWKCREQVRAGGRRYMKKLRADPARNAKREVWRTEYYQKHPNYQRYKAYRSIDNQRFGGETVPWADAEPLMLAPCTYCQIGPSNGLDRRDNDKGHVAGNVVPCCFACNTILGDIPAEAKDLLIHGLTEARRQGFLDNWTPPQKRGSAND